MRNFYRLRSIGGTLVLVISCLFASAAHAADAFAYVNRDFPLSATLTCNNPAVTKVDVQWVFSGLNHPITETILGYGIPFEIGHSDFTAPTRNQSAYSIYVIDPTSGCYTSNGTGTLFVINYPFIGSTMSVVQDEPIMYLAPANTYLANLSLNVGIYVGQDVDVQGPPSQSWNVVGSSISDPSLTASSTGCEADAQPAACWQSGNTLQYSTPGVYSVGLTSSSLTSTSLGVSLQGSYGITIVDGSQYISEYLAPVIVTFINLP